MSNIEELTKLGLSIQESRIYVALLELGPSKVSDILKKTHINRTHIYDRLEKLLSKGLVSSTIINKNKIFYAMNPKSLNTFIQNKEEEFKKQKIVLGQLVNNLSKLNINKLDESIEVFEGKEGLKSVLEDVLSERSEIWTYGSEGNFTKLLPYYFKHYLKKLETNKIKMKVLFNYDDQRHILNLKFVNVRYIPKEYFTPTEITIYRDKVAIFILTPNPKAILIKSKAVSESYRKHFNFMWLNATPSSKV